MMEPDCKALNPVEEEEHNNCPSSGLGSSLQSSQETLRQHHHKQPKSSTGGDDPGDGLTMNNKSWLLRLFESKLFDSSMAMAYMFNSKEPGVLGYIGNKLFSYADSEMDFYLPQMVNMYIMYREVAEVLHPYLVHRCRLSADFSLQCAWLLDAYSADANVPSKKKSHSAKLRNLIQSGELVPKQPHHQAQQTPLENHVPTAKTGAIPKTHMRSRSDATGLLSPRNLPNNPLLMTKGILNNHPQVRIHVAIDIYMRSQKFGTFNFGIWGKSGHNNRL